jgi:undecaprenyl-diphosphatase
MLSLDAFDKGTCFWIETQLRPHTPWLEPIMLGVTFLGGRGVLHALAFSAVAVLLVRRRDRCAACAGLAVLGAPLLTDALKQLVRRDRPEVVLPPPGGYSFPSGHALESTAVYGLLALLALPYLRHKGAQTVLLLGSLLLAFAIGFSRLYLGVHYFTDVVAGWCLGLAWALTCHWLAQPRGGQVAPRAESQGS